LSIAETLLIFAGIPAAIVAAVFALVYGSAGRRASKRYRPGRPFTFTPVWFVANRGQVAESAATAPAISAGTPSPALSAGPAIPAEATGDEPVTVQYGETGGASDSW
jgi:hypothetical protein